MLSLKCDMSSAPINVKPEGEKGEDIYFGHLLSSACPKVRYLTNFEQYLSKLLKLTKCILPQVGL